MPGTAQGAEAKRPITASYPEHTRAVELARAGNYPEALRVLAGLVAEFPQDYPLRRDYLLVAAWSGDCELALREFSLLPERPDIEPYVVGPVRECAARQARAGDTAGALQTLAALEQRAPDDYPVARDSLLVTIWHGDCPGAIERYERLNDPQQLEPYVVVPLANCLLRHHRTQQALTLTRTALDRNPQDDELRHAHLRAEIARRLKGGADPSARELELSLVRQKPEQGVREWLAEAVASMPLAETVRSYVRYLGSRASDAAYAEGEMNRAGVGVRYAPTEQWRMSLELSGDLRHGGRDGLSASLSHLPTEATQLWVAYAGYAEDSPLRGRAIGIEADSWQAGAATRSFDYLWEGRVVAGRYGFSDGNRRDTLYATAGYAYEMRADREQRLYLEWYESRNSLADAVYFNPESDSSLGLVHRTSFVYVSSYRRHVDNLQFWLNDYRQSGYPALWRWGARYEQDYDLDERNAFVWGVSFMRNAYDGAHEDEWRLDARYRWRF